MPQRYGPVLYEMMKDVRYEPLGRRADRARSTPSGVKSCPRNSHAEREAWRDRRLMALIAHKRAMAAKEKP